jgi:hypothetical protein
MSAEDEVLRHIIPPVRQLVLLLLAVVVVAAACSSGQSATFTLGSASVDATYWCPGNANNAPYDVHATVAVHNGTSSAVAITSVTAQMALVDVSGTWLEKTGDAYDAGAATFTPTSVKTGSNATLKVKFQSACTSPPYGSGPASYGDYRITLRVITSAGSHSIAAANLHRILAA